MAPDDAITIGRRDRGVPVDFLHIGKTGGLALLTTLRDVPAACPIRFRNHMVRLSDIPAGGRVVVSVRDPLSRFVSGFNSRLREGLPRKLKAWEPGEREAFSHFASANALAEALSDPAAPQRHRAERAMRAIYHVAHPLGLWLGTPADLRARAPDILWICHQPELDQDFEHLKRLLGLPPKLLLVQDIAGAHRTPPGFDVHLSPRAKANLCVWYADDFPLYESAMALRRSLMAHG